MILCRGDMQLETFVQANLLSTQQNLDRQGTTRCRDFRAVYDEVERNHKGHIAWLAQMDSTMNVTRM